MRALALVPLLAACGSAPPAPAASTLAVTGIFAAPAQPLPSLTIAMADLHLVGIGAVSDRSSSDPRTRVADLDLAMSGTAAAPPLSAPPALYSGLRFTLGDAKAPGIDLMGTFAAQRLHVTISNVPVYVSCSDPLPLDPGGQVELLLHADPTHWFDGVDIASSVADTDDNGILISADDNAPLAARIKANVEASFQLECMRKS